MNRRPLRLALLWMAAATAGYAVRRMAAEPSGPDLSPQHPGGFVAARTMESAGKTKTPLPPSGAASVYLDALAPARLEEMRGLFASYDALADPTERVLALRCLMARWVELNPRDALDFFTARNLKEEVLQALGQWALTDPRALAAYFQDPEHPPILRIKELLMALSRNGSEKAALPLIRALAENQPLESFVDFETAVVLFGHTAMLDFEGTMEVFRKLPDSGFGTSGILRQIAESRALTDPEGALRWARALKKDSQYAVGAVLEQMARRDPARAAAELKNTPGLPEPVIAETADESLVGKIAAGLARSDPAKALNWVREITKDQEDAATMMEGAATRILREAMREPEGLAELFPQLREYLDGKRLYNMDPPADRLEPAFEALKSLPADPARDYVLARMAIMVSQQDPLKALSWMTTVEDPGARKEYAMRLFFPEGPKAAALAREVFAALPPDLKTVAVTRLVEVQSKENAPAAAAWAQTLADPEQMAEATSRALIHWTSNDAAAASAWADSLPPGAARDAAAKGIVYGLADRDPAAAFAWAGSIRNAEDRETGEKSVLEGWLRLDPAGAAAAVEAAALPDDRRADLLRFIQSKRK